jgi:phospholipid/cholesterol/gamma-HCH transport system substrate-binding protein
MAKKTSTVKLGVFIFVGISIFIIAIFLLGGKEFLFTGTFNVRAYFDDIQGLRSGSTVRLSGIDVGSVNNIQIVGETSGRVEVDMKLSQDIRKYITTTTTAAIETEGLVGNKVVILTLSGVPGEPIADDGVIKSKEPMGFAAIVQETQGIMEYTRTITEDLSEIVARVNRGEGSIGKLLVDEELYERAATLTVRADESLKKITIKLDEVSDLFNNLGMGVDTVLRNVNSVVIQFDTVMAGIREGKGVLGAVLIDGSDYDSLVRQTIRDISSTTYDARLAASRLAENMEALKHNWLFKSYFERRGYWDKAEYENEIDYRLRELDEKIQILDDRIETLRKLEAKTSIK